MSSPAWPGRLKIFSILLIIAAFLLILRALPVDALLEGMQVWVKGLGPWGPAVFAAIYAVWTVLFLPGAALTLAGGAIFGLVDGLLAVWVGASVGLALSFLIARYLARQKVSALASANPKFGAIDRAIGQGGWKIVAMLRLSPVMPFNVQNYLYGVTALGFVPAVLTSAVFILPGTFLYVYLGHVAAQAAEAASGGQGRSAAEWGLLAVGLLATVLVTVYVTKLASKVLKEQTAIDEAPAEQAPAPKTTSGSSAIVTAAVAVVLFCAALWAYDNRDSLKWIFGPLAVQASERYQRLEGGPDLDHSGFSELLAEFVSEGGWVDYRGLRAREGDLDAYLGSLATAPFDAMGRDQKLALLINAYNAFTLKLILEYYPLGSIEDIPVSKGWNARRWIIGGTAFSLRDIEHGEIRPKFAEPRIHFALVCASISCPPLRREAYVASRLEEQLADQTRYVHEGDRWFRYEPGSDTLHLTSLYDWYGSDFKQQSGSVERFAARSSAPLKAALDLGKKVKVRYLDYDWALNERKP